MAETSISLNPQDRSSEWAQFDFGPFDQSYALPDQDFHPNAQLPHYSNGGIPPDFSGLSYDSPVGHNLHAYPSCNGMSQVTNHVNHGTPTQEQVAALESSFTTVSKPKADYKKSLAKKIGLDLQGVNRWFKIRQADHDKQSSEATSTDASLTAVDHPLAMLTSETPVSSDPFSDQQTSQGPADYSYSYSLDDYALQLQTQALQSQSTSHSFDINSDSAHSAAFRMNSTTGPSWMKDTQQTLMNTPLPIHEDYSQATSLSLSPQSLPASHAYASNYDEACKEYVSPLSLQNLQSGSLLSEHLPPGNMNSNASSIGDSNHLMTPPDHTPPPPKPWLASEYDHRRSSDSSELAHNVEGLHLQHSNSGLGMVSTSSGPSAHSSVLSGNGINTPDTSPEQATRKPIVPPADLASRRKRSRPAALRPDSNRSVSFAGPLTVSPHSRNSSISIGSQSQVRRIHSSSQLPNKDRNRVHKSTNNSMQISPRNVQARFDRHYSQQTETSTTSETSQASFAPAQHVTSVPSASAASANRSPAEYQHEFAVRRTSASYNSNAVFQMPYANSSVPILPSSSQPSLPLSIQIPNQHEQQQQQQQQFHQGPPLSAPPHQTTFFDDSPIHKGPFLPPHSHSHSVGPQGPNDLGYSASLSLPTTQFTTHDHGSYLPAFAPQYQFPQEASQMPGYSGSSLLPSFPPGVPAAPPLELDIKVEVGPNPKLSSQFDNCTFNNTFSGTWQPNREKK